MLSESYRVKTRWKEIHSKAVALRYRSITLNHKLLPGIRSFEAKLAHRSEKLWINTHDFMSDGRRQQSLASQFCIDSARNAFLSVDSFLPLLLTSLLGGHGLCFLSFSKDLGTFFSIFWPALHQPRHMVIQSLSTQCSVRT